MSVRPNFQIRGTSHVYRSCDAIILPLRAVEVRLLPHVAPPELRIGDLLIYPISCIYVNLCPVIALIALLLSYRV
jgi:hypothetical protein